MLRFIRFKLALTVMLLTACSLNSSDFQSDADILRLQHLEYYGNLLTEYHSKTGTYPFVGEIDVPAYVFVASPQQTDDIQGGPPHAHKTAAFKYLIEELETVLGRNIKEYYDPQYEPDSKPNFYIYMVDGGTYYFAVHTHEAFAFSNPVAKGYNKVEITNNTNGSPHLINPETLFAREDFRLASSKGVSKPDFFSSRETKYLHATKTLN